MGDIGAPEVVARPKEGKVYTFDDLIRERAVDEDQSPLIAYPKTRLGVDDFELFSGKELNRLVDGAAKALLKAGVEPVYQDTIAGIYGPSDLDYSITVFALGRLGYTTFILSPRLPVNAIVNLLQGLPATYLLHAPQSLEIATKTSHELSLKLLPILTRSQYDVPADISPPFSRVSVDGEKENLRKLIMMHSSGSTGLPKPIHYTHLRLLSTLRTAQTLVAFQSVPLFHAHGFVSFIQAIYTRKCIYLFNGHVPQTHETMVKAIKAAKPEIVWTVPYVLKLLAEKREGIEVLKQCKVVSCSGSRCPDELGDLLVSEGIHFGTVFGATEVALILTSLNRPRTDKAWNYLRPPPHVAPYIVMRPFDGPICECVVLDGHRGKLMSNSNDPPNSWHTKDLFIAHPTIPNAWKFVGRADDRVTLTNGEKVLPLPIEGRIQQDPLVKEAVVFGVDRPVPGLLLFRAKTAEGLSDDEFLDHVWPAIQDANSRAEGFSQISRDLVAIIPEEVDCPSTDKSSIKRAAVYRDFAAVIDNVYARLEDSVVGTLRLSVLELEQWIIKSFAELGIQLERETDFFSAGVDSLKAIQMRGLIIKNLDLGGTASAKCPSMIVYDCGDTAKLAKALFAMRAGEAPGTSEGLDEIAVMRSLIEQYSKFEQRGDVASKLPESHVVILTGATGSLGSQILAKLIPLRTVSKIYCLLRATSPEQTATSRLDEALEARNLKDVSSSKKVVALSSDLSKADFGLPSPAFKSLQSEVTHIIHCAWAVNFALPVQSFAPQLASLQNLINLSLSSLFVAPPSVLFCSSVGTAIGTPSPDSKVVITESSIQELTSASPTGYARSKLIAERIIEQAVASGANGTILRIGQIVPAKTSGSRLWNPNEMVPLMIRSALTTGTLPDTSGSSDQCSWIEADTLAKAILEIGDVGEINRKVENSQLVYNLVHPRPFSWKDDFLPALKKAGLEFETTSWLSWLERLKSSEDDIGKNPSRKLLGFWQDGSRGEGKREVVFETVVAEARSDAMRTAESIVTANYVAQLLTAWRGVW